ncbi:MAG: metallophosphoesterase, partial [Providencia heimbachae]|nr:metallophosphoesterase [Providencia heimbachae]
AHGMTNSRISSSAPLAEELFAVFDKRIAQRLAAQAYDLSVPDAVHKQLRQQDNEGYCFVSVGCWGGRPPQSELQAANTDYIKHLILNGVSLDGANAFVNNPLNRTLGSVSHRSHVSKEDSTAAQHTNTTLPIRFVLAAGDNMYMTGVKDVWDTRFFTTFEDFYGDVSGDAGGVNLVPWLVALGNHDYRGNPMAQVEYTFRGPKERGAFQARWAAELGAKNGTDPLFGRRSKEEMLESLRRAGVSGRWYLPHRYYAIQVSKDMVVIALDTIIIHRCEAHLGRDSTKKSRKELRSTSGADCVEADEQKRQVEDWLLEEYANVPFKIVMGHYPVMANGPHPNYPWLASWLIPLMEKSGAAMYVNADNHYLQVSQQRGVLYVNSGGGGGYFGNAYRSGEPPEEAHPNNAFHLGELGIFIHCRVKATSHVYHVGAGRERQPEQHPTTQGEDLFLHFSIGDNLSVRALFRSDTAMLSGRQRKLFHQPGEGGRKKFYHPGYGLVDSVNVKHVNPSIPLVFLWLCGLILIAGFVARAVYPQRRRRKGIFSISWMRRLALYV